MKPYPESPAQLAWKAFKKNKVAVAGLWVLGVLFTLSIVGVWLSPYHYYDQVLSQGFKPPSSAHWLGTDSLGRDLLTRIFYGGRISFGIGIFATAVAVVMGVLYGAIAGFGKVWLDRFMMRALDIISALPYVVFVILVMVFVGRGLIPLLLAIAAVEWLMMARLVRSQVRGLKEKAFVQASEALGQSKFVLILKHILPNTLSTIIVCASITVPYVMLQESLISFLGLGIQAPMASWGTLIKDGVTSMEQHPYLLLFPALVFSVTLLCLNFVGDALRDALDPRRGSV